MSAPSLRLRGVSDISICQGNTFRLNVIDELTDTSMLTSTSIVSILCFYVLVENRNFMST